MAWRGSRYFWSATIAIEFLAETPTQTSDFQQNLVTSP